jgi:hypothetical protein
MAVDLVEVTSTATTARIATREGRGLGGPLRWAAIGTGASANENGRRLSSSLYIMERVLSDE